MKTKSCKIVLSVFLFLSACQSKKLSDQNPSSSDSMKPKEASSITRQFNQSFGKNLPFNDRQDFEDAKRGFIATLPKLIIKKSDGAVVWDMTSYDFLNKDQAPDTVNPSLWRQAQLNRNNGLFQVTDHIYQVRGFDISNMSIIEGETGIIIIDPLISEEVARAALELYYQQRGTKPVVAVIYTHSHVDHYGGVKGVVSEEDVKSGKVKILAPEHFLEDAVSENVFAGNAMGRRATYMYGPFLPRGEKGQVDGGLGKTNSLGTVTLIAPTDTITTTGEKRMIDGVEMVFQMAPNTEAPAEMLIYFPQFKALDAAEDATHTLHNLYTLRGAKIRDAEKWWKTLNLAIKLFGEDVEVVFAQHHWPVWSRDKVLSFLKSQRDLYKFINDQSLRLMNQGYTMTEIGEMLKLPNSLSQSWHNRDYYGSLNHNAKAVYQQYLGWYDSNPANLYALPPEEISKKYVEFMGGSEAILRKAKESYAKGEYRWVVTVMNHLVFADPHNKEARALEADAFEQLAYQAEDPTWRNEFLMGAFELRNGVPNLNDFKTVSVDTLQAMSVEMLMDFMGIHLDAEKAQSKIIRLNWIFPDSDEKYAMSLENSALTYMENKEDLQADASITIPRSSLNSILLKQSTLEKEAAAGRVQIQGDASKLTELLSFMDKFNPEFNIVTP